MAILTRAIEYRDQDTQLTGQFLWNDTGTRRRPGILVVHGGAGVDDHAKGRAKRLAALGYAAFACDMYGKEVLSGGREKIMTEIMALRGNLEKLCRRARAGMAALEAQPEVDGRIAAVGYCFGGMTALELARSGANLAGAISVHGSLDTKRPCEQGSLKARIMVCHGALDPHVPASQVSAFVEEMNRAGSDWQLNIYGGALHGFTHETGPALPGVAYHAQADARSSEAIRGFLAELFALRNSR